MRAAASCTHGIHGIGTNPAQTRAIFSGSVDREGGGSKPHPEGGGMAGGGPQSGLLRGGLR